ncbi:MAG: hypothetical protein GX236_11300 [Clostridiaceae bacterium]|nr:hypothetical protein [Clostridiaceae bacterium]
MDIINLCLGIIFLSISVFLLLRYSVNILRAKKNNYNIINIAPVGSKIFVIIMIILFFIEVFILIQNKKSFNFFMMSFALAIITESLVDFLFLYSGQKFLLKNTYFNLEDIKSAEIKKGYIFNNGILVIKMEKKILSVFISERIKHKLSLLLKLNDKSDYISN